MKCKYDKNHAIAEADREMRTVWMYDIKQHMVVHDRPGKCHFEHPDKSICGHTLIQEEQPTGNFVCAACRARRNQSD